MKIYLLRHGQSIANTKQVYNPVDDELSELGKQQALAAADYMQHLVIKEQLTVLSSSLLRARETAALLGVHAQPVDALADWNVGEFAGKPFGSIRTHCQAKSISKEDLVPAGGETMLEFKQRVRNYLQNLPDKNYLVIAHTDVILEIVNEITGKLWNDCPVVENVSIWIIENGLLVKCNWRPWDLEKNK